MKTTILINTFLIFAISIPAFAQYFDVETKIYHEYIERLSGLPFKGEASDYKRQALDIERDIAEKYGMTPGEVDAITDRAKNTLSEFEWDVFSDLSNKLKLLPNSATQADYDKAWGDVCAKYGINKTVLADIMYKGTQSILAGRRGLTSWERSIFNDFDARIRSLPESATQDQAQGVREYIVNKYGIDHSLLDKIIQKVFVANFKH